MTVYFVVMVLVVILAVLAQPVAVQATHVTTRMFTEPVAAPRRTLVNHAFAILAGALLVGVAALRWRIGVDYITYEQSYPQYLATPRDKLGPLDEPGIRVIAKLGAHVHDDPTTMFAIASLITVGLTVFTIYRNTTMLPLALLLFVIAEVWQGSFNGIRQYLACAVIFAGHRFILDRRFWPYALVILIAMLFHISALVMLLAYWIPRRQLRPFSVVAMMLLAAVAVVFYANLGDAIGTIKNSDIVGGDYFDRNVNPLRILAAFAPSALYVLFAVKRDLSSKAHFYANVMFINGVILLAAAGSAYLARFAIYTGVFLPLAIPEMLNSRERSSRAFLVMVIVALYTVFWFVDTSPVSALNPFRWVFDR